jgi:hypothetical protein
MSTFDELDQYLKPDYQVDYWSDYAIDRATELIDQLSEDDWAELEKTWPDREVMWQVRLADAAFSSGKSRIVNLLCQMLKSPEVKVALAAVESLEARDDVVALDPSLRTDLERLLPHVEEGYHQMLEDLIGRMAEQFSQN